MHKRSRETTGVSNRIDNERQRDTVSCRPGNIFLIPLSEAFCKQGVHVHAGTDSERNDHHLHRKSRRLRLYRILPRVYDALRIRYPATNMLSTILQHACSTMENTIGIPGSSCFKPPALYPFHCVRTEFMKVGCTGANPAAMRSTERNDYLSGKIITLQKCTDNSGGLPVPYRV